MDHIEKLQGLAKRRAAAVDERAAVERQTRDAVISASKSGISAADIADALGVSRARIYQIKSGTR